MKKNILIFIISISPFFVNAQYNISGCSLSKQFHVTLGNDDDNYSLKEEFSSLSNTYTCEMIDYVDLIDIWSLQGKTNKGMGSMWLGATSGDGTCDGYNYSNNHNPNTCVSYIIGWEVNNINKTFTFNQQQEIDGFLRNVINTGVFSPKLFGELIFSFNNTDYFNEFFQIRINLSHHYALKDGAITQSFTKANIKFNIDVWVPTKMKYINEDEFLCNKIYPTIDLFTGIYNPVNYPLLQELTGSFNCNNCGNDINNFLDFSNYLFDIEDYLIEYKGTMKLYGKVIKYIYKKKVNIFSNVYEPLWQDIPIGLNENSLDVPLDAYTNNITSPFLTKEFVGPGVYKNNNNQWFFSPTSANVENNIIYYRTNYKGCKSSYNDTIIFISSLATTNGPILDMTYTFDNVSSNDLALTQIFSYDTINYFSQKYKGFHFVCSEEEYQFKILNPIISYDYEWEVYYHEQLLSSGTGIYFNLKIPSNDSLITDNIYGVQNLDVPFNNVDFITLDTTGIVSNYLGDVIKLKIRSKDITNNYSMWNTYLLGAVTSPELLNEQDFCVDTNLHEVSINNISSNTAYLSFNDLSTYRTIAHQKNLQGDWINYDSIHNYTSPQFVKVDTITVIAKDSIKIYAYNLVSNEWQSIYHPTQSTVCYSEPQTYVFVRKPEFQVYFNEYDTITYGNAVKGEIIGGYFDDSTKYLWNWNDGSETYDEQVHWHFLNDLGSYSVNVEVIDSYGCSNSLYFDSLWFVPGILALEEEIDEVEFSIYPNPTSESFKIKSNYTFDNVEVYNMQGVLVRDFNYLSNYSYNISSLSSGVYTVKINGSVGNYILKLIKK